MVGERTGVDDLIAQSRMIRYELAKTVMQLNAFVTLLDNEVARLSRTIGDPDERIPQREAPPDAP